MKTFVILVQLENSYSQHIMLCSPAKHQILHWALVYTFRTPIIYLRETLSPDYDTVPAEINSGCFVTQMASGGRFRFKSYFVAQLRHCV